MQLAIALGRLNTRDGINDGIALLDRRCIGALISKTIMEIEQAAGDYGHTVNDAGVGIEAGNQ
jgi:hypothetical protein